MLIAILFIGLLIYSFVSLEILTDIEDNYSTIEAELDLLSEDYREKTHDYKFISEKMIADYSALVKNDSLRTFLLAHKGQSEYFEGYHDNLRFKMGNLMFAMKTLAERQQVLLVSALVLLVVNSVVLYKTRKRV